MAYNRITWVPDVLRAAGLTVVEHDGWRTRGLSTARRFEPMHVVWHHDASPAGDSPSVPASMIARFESAAAQLWVDRLGRWHIIASGRAPHAGTVLAGKPDNETSVGVETDHTTGEPWPPAMLASLRKGTAAILLHMGQTATAGLHFHSSICSPPGRKIDPAGLRLTTERAKVGALRLYLSKPAVSLRRLRYAARHAAWALTITPLAARDRYRVRKALAAEKCPTYADWQKRCGVEPTGTPDGPSLTRLAAKHGFRVVS